MMSVSTAHRDGADLSRSSSRAVDRGGGGGVGQVDNHLRRFILIFALHRRQRRITMAASHSRQCGAGVSTSDPRYLLLVGVRRPMCRLMFQRWIGTPRQFDLRVDRKQRGLAEQDVEDEPRRPPVNLRRMPSRGRVMLTCGLPAAVPGTLEPNRNVTPSSGCADLALVPNSSVMVASNGRCGAAETRAISVTRRPNRFPVRGNGGGTPAHTGVSTSGRLRRRFRWWSPREPPPRRAANHTYSPPSRRRAGRGWWSWSVARQGG